MQQTQPSLQTPGSWPQMTLPQARCETWASTTVPAPNAPISAAVTPLIAVRRDVPFANARDRLSNRLPSICDVSLVRIIPGKSHGEFRTQVEHRIVSRVTVS
jgi:hypothetical protein